MRSENRRPGWCVSVLAFMVNWSVINPPVGAVFSAVFSQEPAAAFGERGNCQQRIDAQRGGYDRPIADIKVFVDFGSGSSPENLTFVVNHAGICPIRHNATT